jgi:hypothetical protein
MKMERKNVQTSKQLKLKKKTLMGKNPILCRKHDEGIMLKMWWPSLIVIHNVQV